MRAFNARSCRMTKMQRITYKHCYEPVLVQQPSLFQINHDMARKYVFHSSQMSIVLTCRFSLHQAVPVLFKSFEGCKACKGLSLSSKNIFADVPLAQQKFDAIIVKKYSGQRIHQGQFTIGDKRHDYHQAIHFMCRNVQR